MEQCEHQQWDGPWLCQGLLPRVFEGKAKASLLQMENCGDLGQKVK